MSFYISDFHCFLWAGTNEYGSVFKFKFIVAEHTLAQIDMSKHVSSCRTIRVFKNLKFQVQNLFLFAIIDIRKMVII